MSLSSGRDAYTRRHWAAAYDTLGAARAAGAELSADDLFALADAAWWVGDTATSIEAGEEAYRRFLHGEQTTRASMAAMTVAVNLLLRGDVSLGSGWISRAARLVENLPDAAEHWYVRYLTEVESHIAEASRLPDDEFEALLSLARRVADVGRRLGDANLTTAGTLAEGRIRLKRGDGAAVRLLDEAMVGVLAEPMAPDWAGNAYCHLMAASHEIGDIARAAEWTRATQEWLDTMPAAVLFRGICRVHRSQVMQTLGDWDRALSEAERVRTELAEIAPATAAEAHYQVGDLLRLRGDATGAHRAFAQAHALGRDPQPGMALLQLWDGDVAGAATSISVAAAASRGDLTSCFPLWEAQVRIAVAAGRLDLASDACASLEAAASQYGTTGFEAAAATARGVVEVATGRNDAAVAPLRDACRRWREVGAELHAAEVCLWLAEAYRNLGADADAAREQEAARTTFDRLGVADAARVVRLGGQAALPDGLTAREAEVLALVAAGKPNREIAVALVISEKTVARHLSNIFVKIGVASRTEAAAYAFDHHLQRPAT